MRKRYRDCTRADSVCARCDRSRDGLDCHGRAFTSVETLRRLAGLEQGQLAQSAGISPRLLCRVESGESPLDSLSLKNVRALALALAVNVEALIEGGSAAMRKTFEFEGLEGILEIHNTRPDAYGNICTRFTWGAIEEFPTFRSVEQVEKFLADPDALAAFIDHSAHSPDEFED